MMHYFLLKNSFSIPKLTFTLRGTLCYWRQLLTEYDEVIRSTLQHIMNVELSDDAWSQAMLPVAEGGLESAVRRTSLYQLTCRQSLDHMCSSVNYSCSVYVQLRVQNDPKFTAAVAKLQS